MIRKRWPKPMGWPKPIERKNSGINGDRVSIAGIVLVQGSNQSQSVSSFSNDSDVPFGNRNLTLLDLLGDSLLNRVVTRLQTYGIQPVTVISDIDLAQFPHLNWDNEATLECSPSSTIPTSSPGNSWRSKPARSYASSRSTNTAFTSSTISTSS